MKTLGDLPHDVVALMPLAQRDLAALACVSRGMRDTVTSVRCRRGIALPERWAHVLRREGYAGLVALCVVGPSQPPCTAPSPQPVQRPLPQLTSLRMRHCRPVAAFWADTLRLAPRLTHVALEPWFSPATYRPILESCVALVTEGARQLTRLEIRGRGMALWGWSGAEPHTPVGQGFLMNDVLRRTDVHMSALRHVEITGRQFFVGLDAPVQRAVLEEPDEAGSSMVERLGPCARRELRALDLSVPALKLPLRLDFGALDTLHIRVRDIVSESSFARAVDALSHVPPTVTCLGLTLEFERLDCDEELEYDRAPLAHASELRRLDLTVSFPTPGCADLLTGLLGCTERVEHVRLEAAHAAAHHLVAARDAMYEDDDADPNDEDMWDLEADIERLQDDAVVVWADVETALARFPRAAFEIHGGFEVRVPRPHPRVTCRCRPPYAQL